MQVKEGRIICGIVGLPLAHSLSPAMHTAAFRSMGLDAEYRIFETEDIKGVIELIRSTSIRGLSVTMPHKRGVIPLLDAIEETARRVGAVNTIVNSAGRLTGHNTDANGLISCMDEEGIACQGRALLIGAGGAARAAAFVLRERGIRVAVTNRNEERGRAFAAEMGCAYLGFNELEMFSADIMINATPLGMSPLRDLLPVPEALIRKEMTVIDLIYNPPETRLLSLARGRGCRTISGLSMFVYQGALQFRLWTGLNAPIDIMRKAVEGCLKQRLNGGFDMEERKV
jgi:shikimate dehydrogenase